MCVDVWTHQKRRQLRTNQDTAIGYGSCNRSATVHGFRYCWIQEPDLWAPVSLLPSWLGFPQPLWLLPPSRRSCVPRPHPYLVSLSRRSHGNVPPVSMTWAGHMSSLSHLCGLEIEN